MTAAQLPKDLHLWSVSQITAQLKDALEDAFVNLWIVGEISSLKPASSGHCYFNLKDKGAVLRTILWKSDVDRLRFQLRDGLEVIVHGRLTLYAPRGDYQLQADRIIPRGDGEHDLALKQLKEKLQSLGYFAKERKKPIPRFPRHVALVTSPRGAAIRDMLEILGRRWPRADVLVCPVRVQGAGAARDLAQVVTFLNRIRLDVIILGRGGGSSEDLAAFNEEIVAHAIFASKIPIISAVGHEIDVTIADLVADRRALTPSEAAELATPDRLALIRQLELSGQRLRHLIRGRVDGFHKRMRELTGNRVLRRPRDWLRSQSQRLDDLTERLERVQKKRLDLARNKLHALAGKLQALSPLNVLARGYSLTRTVKDQHVVRSAEQVKRGDWIEVLLRDGRLLANVEQVLPPDPNLRLEEADE